MPNETKETVEFIVKWWSKPLEAWQDFGHSFTSLESAKHHIKSAKTKTRIIKRTIREEVVE